MTTEQRLARGFSKRIFTPRTFAGQIRGLLKRGPSIRLNSAFEEKIMLAVTAVNGCVYCSWFHARRALKCGVDSREIRSLLTKDLGKTVDEKEMVALLYAQRFAESGGNPRESETAKLVETYGSRKSAAILRRIRMIEFGNLAGNTFDAFISRIRGCPASQSDRWFEFLFFLLTAPVLMPARWIMNRSPSIQRRQS